MGFDRVYSEVDGLKLEVRELRTEIGGIQSDIEGLSGKFDIFMAHITESDNAGS